MNVNTEQATVCLSPLILGVEKHLWWQWRGAAGGAGGAPPACRAPPRAPGPRAARGVVQRPAVHVAGLEQPHRHVTAALCATLCTTLLPSCYTFNTALWCILLHLCNKK